MSVQDVDNWLPLWIGDYLADTMHLTTEQHGAYLLLIMHQWKHGELPDDDGVLGTITRLSPAAWKRARPVLARFFVVEAGRWVQGRAAREKAEAVANRDRITTARSAAGRAGAAARWSKGDPPDDGNGNGKPDGKGNGKRIANAWQTDGSPPSPKDDSSLRSESSGGDSVELGGTAPLRSWADWARWWRSERGVEVNPSDVRDRKRFVPLAERWIAAGITPDRMRRALDLAERQTTEPIAYLPAYVDRVLAGMQAPDLNGAAAKRAAFVASITGGAAGPSADPMTVDVHATEIPDDGPSRLSLGRG